jgi:ABC-type phosphate transport system permease subunit
MGILRAKVPFSRTVWITVAIVVAALLSNAVVSHKGADIIHVYDMWLWLFKSSSYQEGDLPGILQGIGTVALVTVLVIVISVAAGWLAASLVGSFAAVRRKRNDLE